LHGAGGLRQRAGAVTSIYGPAVVACPELCCSHPGLPVRRPAPLWLQPGGPESPATQRERLSPTIRACCPDAPYRGSARASVAALHAAPWKARPGRLWVQMVVDMQEVRPGSVTAAVRVAERAPAGDAQQRSLCLMAP